MTIAVGIFDLFTYTIPGALYLGLFSYVAFRLHWLNPTAVDHLPTFLLVVILVLASYLLGYIAYPIGAGLNRVLPKRRDRSRYRAVFLQRVPAARHRDFVHADHGVLFSAIQWQDKDVAADVNRLRAAGLMLRNSAPALLLGATIAFIEIFTSPHPAPPIVIVILLGFGSIALTIQGRRLSHWANLKTLELAFWVPEVDEKVREP